MQISTISFDGDMTLWDFRKVMRHSLKHTLIELQKQRPTPRVLNLTIDEMIAIREQFAEAVKGEIWSLEEIRLRAFERTLEHVGCPDKDLAAHLNATYRKHRFEDIELYPNEESLAFSEKNTLHKSFFFCYHSKHGTHRQRYNKKYTQYHKIERGSNRIGRTQDTRGTPKTMP